MRECSVSGNSDDSAMGFAGTGPATSAKAAAQAVGQQTASMTNPHSNAKEGLVQLLLRLFVCDGRRKPAEMHEDAHALSRPGSHRQRQHDPFSEMAEARTAADVAEDIVTRACNGSFTVTDHAVHGSMAAGPATDSRLERLSHTSQASSGSANQTCARVLSSNLSGNTRKLTPNTSMQLRATLGPRLAGSRSMQLMLSAGSITRRGKVSPVMGDASAVSRTPSHYQVLGDHHRSPSMSRHGPRRLCAASSMRQHSLDGPATRPDVPAIERRALHRNSESCGSRFGTNLGRRNLPHLQHPAISSTSDHGEGDRTRSESCLPPECRASVSLVVPTVLEEREVTQATSEVLPLRVHPHLITASESGVTGLSAPLLVTPVHASESGKVNQE